MAGVMDLMPTYLGGIVEESTYGREHEKYQKQDWPQMTCGDQHSTLDISLFRLQLHVLRQQMRRELQMKTDDRLLQRCSNGTCSSWAVTDLCSSCLREQIDQLEDDLRKVYV